MNHMDHIVNDYRTDLMAYIYDAHKDAYGFRDRSTNLNAMTTNELNAYADMLSDAVCATIEREREIEAECVERFEAQVAETIAMGARDRATAVRWIIDAEMPDAQHEQDVDHVRWQLGLPYNYNMERGQQAA